MKKLQYIVNSLASIFVAGMVLNCNHTSAKKNEIASASAKESVVETFILQKEKISTHLQLPGELVAFQQVDLYAKVTGFVKQLNADIGTEVKTGQLLLTLEAPELSAQLNAAEARLKSQQALYTASLASYNRIAETSKTPGTISQNDLDQASAKKNSDLANYEAAKASIKEISDLKNYLQIKAPFNGVVTARNINLGAYVGPSGKGSEFPLLTIQQQDKLRLVISVPEAFTSYLQRGDEVTFKVRSYPGETFTAKIERMAGALDLRLRAERIEIDILNANKKLLPGTVADVSISLMAKDSTFVIPKSALINSTEGIFIIKVIDGKAEKIEVKRGRDMDTKIEIFGQLKQGDTLITKASDEIKTGTAVKIN